MTGASIPDDNHVARYCKPSTIGEDGLPMSAAFTLRKDEDYLSVNWIEYFRAANLETAVDYVRDKIQIQVRPNGRFAVLSVGGIRATVQQRVGSKLRVEHLPLTDDKSHSGIIGYTHTAEDLAIAVAIKAQLKLDHIYPGIK